MHMAAAVWLYVCELAGFSIGPGKSSSGDRQTTEAAAIGLKHFPAYLLIIIGSSLSTAASSLSVCCRTCSGHAASYAAEEEEEETLYAEWWSGTDLGLERGGVTYKGGFTYK